MFVLYVNTLKKDQFFKKKKLKHKNIWHKKMTRNVTESGNERKIFQQKKYVVTVTELWKGKQKKGVKVMFTTKTQLKKMVNVITGVFQDVLAEISCTEIEKHQCFENRLGAPFAMNGK